MEVNNYAQVCLNDYEHKDAFCLCNQKDITISLMTKKKQIQPKTKNSVEKFERKLLKPFKP